MRDFMKIVGSRQHNDHYACDPWAEYEVFIDNEEYAGTGWTMSGISNMIGRLCFPVPEPLDIPMTVWQDGKAWTF